MFHEISSQIESTGLVPVIAIDEAENAMALGKALVDGGLPTAEVTFRTSAATETIRILCGECPNLLVGAGTVLSRDKVRQAIQAGAQFIVTPGFNEYVVEYCLQENIPVFPGVCTPTEIECALKKALSVLKFFPAEAIGGVPYLKAISAPYSEVRFVPTGGIDSRNLNEYLSLSTVIACGSSWVVSPDLLAAKRFNEITRRVEEAVELVRRIREGKT